MNARRVLPAAVTVLLAITAAAPAQETVRVPDLPTPGLVDRVRTLYDAASYEEALAAIPSPAGEPARTDLERYRALCLLALGREKEAVSTVERLVQDNPMFLPAAADTSPRMQAIFAAARLKLVPDIAKRTYAEAKAAYESRAREVAHLAFDRTIALIDSLPEAERAPLSDLRLLAGEFRELTAPKAAAGPDPVSAPGPSRPDPPAEYVGPAAIREQMPPWNPPDRSAARTEYLGLVRVLIGEDGHVQSALILKPSHPAYDGAVLSATKDWLYRPATRGGRAVTAQKELQIRLVPRRGIGN
jgi:hypothetical protein